MVGFFGSGGRGCYTQGGELCENLLGASPCPTEPMPPDSKMDTQLATAKPIWDNIFKKRGKNCAIAIAAGERSENL